MSNSNTANRPIRVLIADDHPIVREGLRVVISAHPDIQLVGMAEDGQQAIRLATEVDPDVIVMDILMPTMDGLTAIREISAKKVNVAILVLTSYLDDDHVFQAIKDGASGYFLKDAPPQQLIDAIRQIHMGEAALQPIIARRLMQEIAQSPVGNLTEDPLTAREVEVLRCLARGLSNADIAHELTISVRTAATHIRNILGKLHLANRTQAAIYAKDLKI